MSKPQLSLNANDAFQINIVSDGTVTSAEVRVRDTGDVFSTWDVVGRGVAKRRKGDRRDDRFAYRLAATRALRNAASTLGEGLEEYL